LSTAVNKIVQQGVLWLRTARFEDIQRVRWRRWPEAGSVVLYAPSARIAIHFANFTPEDRREIIEFLRQSIAEDVQEAWSRFDAMAAKSSTQS
jgi:hypothetical protein